MKGLVEPDEGVVEVRLRGAVTDINGRLCDAFIGYRFTWDRNLECWRWVQTCLYTKDEDGPFAGQPVI
jgi:hypothetical protein